MEFKFRAIDNRPPNHVPSSSPSLSTMSGPGFRRNPNFNQIRPDLIQRELEKEQIREEIIASEVARRRALEAEVRRELMAEWEMAAWHRVRETGLSFENRLTMRLDPRLPFMHHFNNNHHRWQPHGRFSFLPPPPTPPPPPPPLPPMLLPQVTEVSDTEVKDTSEGNKNKLIILAKPDPNRVVGAKRKTPPSAGAGELSVPLISLKKKPDEEWSCAICQVSTTSEKGLTEHIQGRKHKANEARLKTQRMEKISNTNTTTSPKKPRKRAKVADMPITTGLGSETEEKLPQLSKNVDGSDQKLEDGENFKNKEDELLIKKEKKAKRFRKKHRPTAEDNVERTPELEKREKYEFWCEICLVGVHSENVMETHKKGRRHIARLLKLDKSNAAAPATTTNAATEQARSDGTQMSKVTDMVAEEANEKLINVPEADNYYLSPVAN